MPSEENLERARALIPYEVPSRDADIRAIATALDAAEQRGAEREREACATDSAALVVAMDANAECFATDADMDAAIVALAAAIRARSES